MGKYEGAEQGEIKVRRNEEENVQRVWQYTFICYDSCSILTMYIAELAAGARYFIQL